MQKLTPGITSPFLVGDTVFIQPYDDNMQSNPGQAGLVVAVLPDIQKCVVSLGEGQPTKGYTFPQLSLIKPERRSPDEDYLRAIAHAVTMRGYGPRLTRWWQKQADAKIWATGEMPDLHTAFRTFQAKIDAEMTTEIDRQHAMFRRAFAGLTHAQKVEKWKSEWFSWTEFHSFLQPYLGSSEEERLLRAILGEDEASDKDEEHDTYHRSGLALWERCEGHMARLGQAAYAYDTVPFRPVLVESTMDKSFPLISPAPIVPAISRRLPLLKHEQAMAALQGDGELFQAALVSLASTSDGQAVTALLATFTDLKNQEGFASARWDRQRQLEMALLTTRQEEAVLRVLHNKLEGSAYLPYSVQGVMLKGDAGPLFWGANPWRIHAEEAVENVIARIWAPVMHRAPRFFALLSERVIGLALIKRELSDAPHLAYLTFIPHSSYVLQKSGITRKRIEQIDITNLLDWLDQGIVSLFLGNPPHDPNDDHARGLSAFRLPLAMREFCAIHNGMGYHGSFAIHSPDEIYPLLSWFFEGMSEDQQNFYLSRFHMGNQGRLPQQFIAVTYDGSGNVSVFDRDLLDERLDPQVACWDHETWQVGQRKPFWSWFDDYIPSLFDLQIA